MDAGQIATHADLITEMMEFKGNEVLQIDERLFSSKKFIQSHFWPDFNVTQ